MERSYRTSNRCCQRPESCLELGLHTISILESQSGLDLSGIFFWLLSLPMTQMIIRCAHDELLPISELKRKFHPRNPNQHSKEQIERLAKLLKYQGTRHPAIISKQSGFLNAGHGRVLAAEVAGWTWYPVNYQDFDDEAQEYASLVADNEIARWSLTDKALVNEYIGDLGPDFDLDLLGFKEFEVDVADKRTPGCDEDDIPGEAEAPARTRKGDIYSLGAHRLMCGDSTDWGSVESLMNGEKADMVFTSPPYNIGRSKGGSGGHKKYENYADDLTDEEYKDLLTDVLAGFRHFSKYQFINLQFLDCNRISLISWLYDFKNHLKDIMVWNKKHSSIAPDYVLHATCELIFIFETEPVKNRAIYLNDPLKGIGTVIERQETMIQKEDHKAGFPVYLPEYILNTFKPLVCIDPFGGTGSTLIACEKTNRKCFMMEIDPHYCDVIISRWEKYTGKKAELICSQS